MTSKALALIRLVVVESQKSKNSEEVLEKLDLTILISLIKEDDDVAADDASVNTTNEVEKNLTELMRVLHELVKTPFVRVKVLEIFSVEKMQVLMKTILESNNDSIVVETPRNLFQVLIYLHENFNFSFVKKKSYTLKFYCYRIL